MLTESHSERNRDKSFAHLWSLKASCGAYHTLGSFLCRSAGGSSKSWRLNPRSFNGTPFNKMLLPWVSTTRSPKRTTTESRIKLLPSLVLSKKDKKNKRKPDKNKESDRNQDSGKYTGLERAKLPLQRACPSHLFNKKFF